MFLPCSAVPAPAGHHRAMGGGAAVLSVRHRSSEQALVMFGKLRPGLGVDQARRPLALEDGNPLPGRADGHVGTRLFGYAGDVRGDQHVVEGQQRMIQGRRFSEPDVDPGAGDVADRMRGTRLVGRAA